tara:strand:- start:640 stop:864 length:225 start_codon:yes stop_codon:yes gene_type:complete
MAQTITVVTYEHDGYSDFFPCATQKAAKALALAFVQQKKEEYGLQGDDEELLKDWAVHTEGKEYISIQDIELIE